MNGCRWIYVCVICLVVCLGYSLGQDDDERKCGKGKDERTVAEYPVSMALYTYTT